jgi:hypothetical protein
MLRHQPSDSALDKFDASIGEGIVAHAEAIGKPRTRFSDGRSGEREPEAET